MLSLQHDNREQGLVSICQGRQSIGGLSCAILYTRSRAAQSPGSPCGAAVQSVPSGLPQTPGQQSDGLPSRAYAGTFLTQQWHHSSPSGPAPVQTPCEQVLSTFALSLNAQNGILFTVLQQNKDLVICHFNALLAYVCKGRD